MQSRDIYAKKIADGTAPIVLWKKIIRDKKYIFSKVVIIPHLGNGNVNDPNG